jgi:hypothetical protein
MRGALVPDGIAQQLQHLLSLGMVAPVEMPPLAEPATGNPADPTDTPPEAEPAANAPAKTAHFLATGRPTWARPPGGAPAPMRRCVGPQWYPDRENSDRRPVRIGRISRPVGLVVNGFGAALGTPVG